jgi:hypothetical protein
MAKPWREAEWERISRLAGLTPEGGIAPPEPCVGIDRAPNPLWRNQAYDSQVVAIADEDVEPGDIMEISNGHMRRARTP